MINVEKVKEELSEKLFSGKEFNEVLDTLVNESYGELQGICYYCSQLNNSTMKNLVYGVKGEGKATYNANDIDLGNGICIDIFIWTSSKKYNIETMKELFEKYWNSNHTIKVSGIMSTYSQTIINKCQKTIDYSLDKSQMVAIFTMDLDYLKKINDTYGMDTGDRVIREFASVLLSASNNRGILIHRSGDEFYLIYSCSEYLNVLSLAWDLYNEINNHDFDFPEKKLTFSLGIRLVETAEIDFDKETIIAQKLYRPSENKKNRNSVRIDKQNGSIVSSEKKLFKVAASRVIANLFNSIVFHNIYLDYLADVLCVQGDLENIACNIKRFLEWIDYTLFDSLRCCSDTNEWDTSNFFSIAEIGLAIFKGILNNKNLSGEIIEVDFGEFEENVISISVNGAEIFKHNNLKISEKDKCRIKKTVPDFNQIKTVNHEITRKVVLLQAGYEYKSLPKDIFFKIVKVDSRPFIGGGLPDSWAAALCELISAMEQNKNFNRIIIFGDTSSTYKIKSYLDNIKEWADNNSKFSYYYIAKKTFKNNKQIRSFQEKFKDNIFTVSTEDSLIDEIFEYYCDNDLDYTVDIVSKISESKRILHRDLSIEDIRLDIFDGCKAKSLSDAYPMVLEILRQKYQSKSYPKTVDQAERNLLELTNFIITLTNPQKNDLPNYYIDDGEELDEYYKNTFMSNDGLFRKAIERDGQLTAMLEHVYSTVEHQNLFFATRRAILVLSNEFESPKDYSPLGLVSIWLCPRFNESGEKLTVDFSFTWRTVEALVGLPISLYSSINYSYYLLEQINSYVKKRQKKLSVELGKVSYFAYSLHMFLDKENMNIIRGIVNEATI